MLKLLAVLLLALYVSAEPKRPLTIFGTFTAIERSNTKLPYKKALIYWDQKHQRMRRDVSNELFDEIEIKDWTADLDYLYRKDKGEDYTCGHMHVKQHVNPFTFDMFKDAKFVGETTANGKKVNKWENVKFLDTASYLTAYMDVKTNLVVRYEIGDTWIEVDIKSTAEPDASLFKMDPKLKCTNPGW